MARLAGGVAHDMNNILLVMRGYTDMALTEPDTAPSVGALLREVNAANQRAARLTRDLSLLARSGSPALRSVDLNASLGVLIARLEQEPAGRTRADWEPCAGLLPVLVDEGMLERILSLLFEWAAETAADGVNIRTEQERSSAGAFARVHFTAKGPSPDVGLLALIFEPYAPGAGGGKGPGLRLAVVRTIVRRLGGTAGAEAPPTGGTRISISLPCGPPTGPSAGVGAAPSAGEAAGKPAILLAEHDERIRSLALGILQREGYTVVPARDGQEALDLFQSSPGRIGLLLLAEDMPRMGGRTALARIRALDPAVPAIISGGYSWVLGGTQADVGVSSLPSHWKPRELLLRVQESLKGAR